MGLILALLSHVGKLAMAGSGRRYWLVYIHHL